MEKRSALLSILIATKNRIPYCIKVIDKILDFTNQDFELIVQDNSDSLELFDYAGKIKDQRFRYNYTAPPFSSIDNFNKVISLAKGSYVCLIGDDDCITSEIFEAVKWANENNIDSIVPSLKAVYWWPDATKNIKGKEKDNGLLEISNISSNIKEYSTTGEVEKLMKSGGQNYMDLNLPKLYHGIVKRKYLNLIKEKTGHYVGGLSPDIYLAVALSSFINKIVKIDYPLTIPGICIASTSADSATKKNTSKLEDAPHFRDRGEYFWAKEVPRFYSGINIWADSAIASLHDMEEHLLVRKFNVMSLSSILLKRHKNYKEEIINHYLDFYKANVFIKRYIYIAVLKTRVLSNFFSGLYIRFCNKLIKVFLNKEDTSVKLKNINNIGKALDLFLEYVSKNNFKLHFYEKKK
ncbi:hypothetical protein DS884_17540 [Tenacibaculum sp. E3R01]|uniref:glycosyltransferase family 2 protein n=1 Tax=Tenacibaculum sp. E3R01 TaxID=2267227 RepID=UPI000DE8FAC6|nr:glycosyltransferase family A protein [Tenacibaculum sp. E3R01]RBW54257.1 hypothetical protein DS884_17540 [Tenacibaculum sp. E3R01]